MKHQHITAIAIAAAFFVAGKTLAAQDRFILKTPSGVAFSGIPANGTSVPDGAAMAKVEWVKLHNTARSYALTVPGPEGKHDGAAI